MTRLVTTATLTAFIYVLLSCVYSAPHNARNDPEQSSIGTDLTHLTKRLGVAMQKHANVWEMTRK